MTTGRYALALFELGQENSELNEMEVRVKKPTRSFKKKF